MGIRLGSCAALRGDVVSMAQVESKGKFSREKIDVMNWRRSAGAGAVEGPQPL
jgi:hypothetical protein